jgi:signal-transduction protein with cAMP-binding, CBS, and nucleotidyltransferase domain
MKVESLLWPWVASIAPTEPLDWAARRMREFDVGCIVVSDRDALVGIVTERDLLRAAAEGVSPRAVIVRDYMTHDPVTVDEDEDVAEAAAVMVAIGARHLPVLRGDEVVGMLSIRDLLPHITNGKVVNLAQRRAVSGRRVPKRLGDRAVEHVEEERRAR